MTDSADKYFIIVYQFGKVASSSIVKSFSNLDGISAVQTHFMGEHNLKRMVSTLTNPATSQYFLDHAMGQFIQNVSTTRRFNSFRHGLMKPTELVIISATREPFEWFRSSFSQDLEGHIPALAEYCVKRGIGFADPGELILVSVPAILAEFAKTISSVGGIDNIIIGGELHQDVKSKIVSRLPDGGLRRLFFNMMNPHSWFDSHFCKSLGVNLAKFETLEAGLLWSKPKWGQAYIFQFERLEESINAIADKLGCQDFVLVSENVSKEKKYWREIETAFSSPSAVRLQAKIKNSRYSRFFGYNR